MSHCVVSIPTWHKEMVGIDFTAAARTLSSLDQCRTPLQMLYVLTDCVDCIISTVENSDTGSRMVLALRLKFLQG